MKEKDSTVILQKHLSKFTNRAKNLLNTTQNNFEKLFEELYTTDKRALYLFIKDNKINITEEQLNFAINYYKERERDLKWQ